MCAAGPQTEDKNKDALIDMKRIELCQTAATAAPARRVFACPQMMQKPEVRSDQSQIPC
jgi:hypothetical protein